MTRRHLLFSFTTLIVVLGMILPAASAHAQLSVRADATLPLCFAGSLEVTIAASPMRLQNCQVSGLSDPGNAGAIYVDGGATLNLTGVLLSGNTAGSSGGAIFNNGTLTLTNVTATNNLATNGAGGTIFNDGTLTISGSTFQGNSAGYGGAIFSDQGSALTVTSSTFGGAAGGQGNTASQSGGGIYTNYATATIIGTTFTNNTVGYSGGGLELYGGQVSLHSSTFTGNHSGVDAGAIQVGLGTLCNCGTGDPTVKITGNTASGADGGGIENHFGQVTLNSATVAGNSAGAGGGMYSKSGTYTFSNSTFSNNAPQNCATDGLAIMDGGGNSDSDGSCGFTPLPTPVAGGAPLAQDTFAGRTVSSGWGTASSGAAWVLQSGTTSLLSVANNEAHIAGASSSPYQILTLGTTTATNEEVVGRYSTGSFGDDAARLLLRFLNTKNYYAAGIDSPKGTPQLDIIRVANGTQHSLCTTPFPATNGSFYWERVRVQTSGKSAVLSVRAWAAGTAEPATWQLSCTDTAPLGAGLTGVDAWDGGVGWSLDTYSAGNLGSGAQIKTAPVLPAAPIRPCGLLTSADVRAIYGSVMRTGTERTIPPFESCRHVIKGGVVTFLAATTTMLSQRNGLTAAQMYFRIDSTLSGQVQGISRLGDRAIWAPGTHQLWVLKGALLFSLSCFQPGNATLDLLQKAARAVLAHSSSLVMG